MDAFRVLAAIVASMGALTLSVELTEFLIVALLNGGFTTDQEAYLSIRNRPAVLALKTVYNTLGAVLAGWLAARIAAQRATFGLIAVGVVQTGSFVYALATPHLRDTGPVWMWLTLIPLTLVGLAIGGRLAPSRRTG